MGKPGMNRITLLEKLFAGECWTGEEIAFALEEVEENRWTRCQLGAIVVALSMMAQSGSK